MLINNKNFPLNKKCESFHKMKFALESWLSGVHSMSWYVDQDQINSQLVISKTIQTLKLWGFF